MTQIRTQFDLMCILANRLTGRDCIVRLQEPVTKNSLATMQVNPEGVPVIHVSPGLGQWTLHSLLHECAHVRLHYGQISRSSIDQARPRSITVTKEQKSPVIEDQADQLRDQWLAWGVKHADPTLPTDEGIMWALLNFYAEEADHE